jgi:hypothetical protein
MGESATWFRFIGLSKMALEWAVGFAPVAVAILAWLAIAVVMARPDRPRGGWLLQLLPVVIPFVILVLGALFPCQECGPPNWNRASRNVWAMRAIDYLMLAQFGVGVLLAWLSPQPRHFSAGLQLLLLWCSWCAAAPAGMSVSGSWL